MSRSHPGDGITEIDHGFTSAPRRRAEGESLSRVRVDEIDKARRLPGIPRRLAVRPHLPLALVGVAELFAIGQRFAALPHSVLHRFAACPPRPCRGGAECDELGAFLDRLSFFVFAPVPIVEPEQTAGKSARAPAASTRARVLVFAWRAGEWLRS